MRKISCWMIGFVLVGLLAAGSVARAAEGVPPPVSVESTSVYKTLGLGLAAMLSITLSVLGASYAVARIGSAALGAAAEKPELLTRSILLVALAEGLAVLGFAIAMMLVQKI